MEAVKTSQASGDRMFMDAVAGERTHCRCPRVRARLRAEGETHTPLTRCHRRCLRGGPRGRADARLAVRRCAWARHSAGTATSACAWSRQAVRSEEHTSELQSRLHLVCRLLLEKKKNNNTNTLVLN